MPLSGVVDMRILGVRTQNNSSSSQELAEALLQGGSNMTGTICV
jgi:hypothetical protein